MMYAANIPLNTDTDNRSKHFTAGLLQAVKANRRPHYLYGTWEKMRNGAPIALEPLRNTFFDKYSPLTGSITKESDRDKIKELTVALQPYIDANKVTEGYVGERNAAGQMHGHGTYTFASGDVHVGEFKDDQMSGHGTFTFACGDVYVGEFKDDKRNGHGTFTSASGDVYVGEFKDGLFHGHGTFTYASGDVYVGNIKMVRGVVMVLMHMVMVMSMLGNMKMIRGLVIVLIHMVIVMYMLGNIKMVRGLVMVLIHMLVVMYMLGNIKMIR